MSKDLFLLAAVVGGGYLILKTTKLGESLGSVGEGVGEAVGGIGAGLGSVGEGVGQAISDISGQVSSITGDVAQLTSFVGEMGVWTAQQFEEMQSRSLREHTQATEVDVSAFDKIKEDLAIIQARKEIIAAEEKAERDRLIQEEKTQYVEFATTMPERLSAIAGAVGGGLLSAWKYSPTGLLTSWITSQSSVEEIAAPQQTAPSITTTSGVLTGAVTSSIREPVSSTSPSTSTISSTDTTTSDMLTAAGLTTKTTSDYLGDLQVTTGVYSEARPKYTAPTTIFSRLKSATSWISPFW